eukprot:8096172-Pyramimonas_sp.AAC.1
MCIRDSPLLTPSSPPLAGAAREAKKRPWLQLLPSVDTPPFQFSESELAEVRRRGSGGGPEG